MITKQVYDTRQIAHMWAHQTQQYARNQQGNFYLEGTVIYSYGKHFPIARIVTHQGKQCVLLTTNERSVTTAKHISLVRQAISPIIPVFAVDDVMAEPTELWKAMKERVTDRRKLCQESPNKTQICIRYSALLKAIEDAKRFAEFFGYGSTIVCRLAPNHNQLVAMIADRNNTQQQRNEENDRKRRLKWQRRGEANKIEAERRKAEELERDRIDNERLADDIAAWRKGGPWFRLINKQPTMLRVVHATIENDGDREHSYPEATIETSRGIDILLSHALRVLPIVEELLLDGCEYHANGHTIRLGHYQIDSIDSQGTLRAGCHVILKDELLRLIEEIRHLANDRLETGSSALPIEPASNWR